MHLHWGWSLPAPSLGPPCDTLHATCVCQVQGATSSVADACRPSGQAVLPRACQAQSPSRTRLPLGRDKLPHVSGKPCMMALQQRRKERVSITSLATGPALIAAPPSTHETSPASLLTAACSNSSAASLAAFAAILTSTPRLYKGAKQNRSRRVQSSYILCKQCNCHARLDQEVPPCDP